MGRCHHVRRCLFHLYAVDVVQISEGVSVLNFLLWKVFSYCLCFRQLQAVSYSMKLSKCADEAVCIKEKAEHGCFCDGSVCLH